MGQLGRTLMFAEDACIFYRLTNESSFSSFLQPAATVGLPLRTGPRLTCAQCSVQSVARLIYSAVTCRGCFMGFITASLLFDMKSCCKWYLFLSALFLGKQLPEKVQRDSQAFLFYSETPPTGRQEHKDTQPKQTLPDVAIWNLKWSEVASKFEAFFLLPCTQHRNGMWCHGSDVRLFIACNQSMKVMLPCVSS